MSREDYLIARFGEGYTRIPNRLLEALIISDLNRVQLSICLFILRCTNGWNRDDVPIPLSEIAAACDCSVSYAALVMRTLIKKNVLRRVVFQPDKIPVYTINFVISDWDESYLDLDRFGKMIADGIFNKSYAGVQEVRPDSNGQLNLELQGVHPGSDAQLNLELQGVRHLEFNGVSNYRCGGDSPSALEPPELEEGLKKGLKKEKKREYYCEDSHSVILYDVILHSVIRR